MSAVVAVTHDPKLDDLALMEALKTPAFYVGALGSRRNNDNRRLRLLDFDVSQDEVARLRGPVGLRLGGLTPPEIAMSIVAEMTAVRRGVDLAGPLRLAPQDCDGRAPFLAPDLDKHAGGTEGRGCNHVGRDPSGVTSAGLLVKLGGERRQPCGKPISLASACCRP